MRHSYRPPPRDLGVRGASIVQKWTLVLGTGTYIAFAVPFVV